MIKEEELICYEDDNVIVCKKPVGLASQSEKGMERNLVSMMQKVLVMRGENPYIAIINRLDKPVCGLVLLAKNKEAAGKLSALSGAHSIKKNYYAIVSGRLEKKGEFEDYLVKDHSANVSRIVSKNTENCKLAKLLYEPLETRLINDREYTLVKIKLLTGRHHQIRVQFSGHGYPLYGDMKYNPDYKEKTGEKLSPALYAYCLSFENPCGHDTVSVKLKPEEGIWSEFTGYEEP